MRQAIHTLAQGPPILAAAAVAPAPASIEPVLAAASSRYILVYPVLRAVTGSAKGALMLSQMLYWTRTYLADHPERGGWFWQTQEDWRASTGLSRHEQDHVRAALCAAGLVHERLCRTPARMHYRVDLDALGAAVARHLNVAYAGWRWEDAAIKAMLGRPVTFLRALVDAGGSVTAALYLSDLCQQQRTLERNAMRGYPTLNSDQRELDAGAGWLDLPLGETANRLGLTPKRLRAARRRLIEAGLIEERSSGGIRPRTLSRVDVQALARALDQAGKDTTRMGEAAAPSPTAAETASRLPVEPSNIAENSQQVLDFAGMAQTYIPDVPKPANWNGANVHSRDAETGKLDVPKPANLLAGLGISIKTLYTKNLEPQLPTAGSPPATATAPRTAGSRGLVNSGQTQGPIPPHPMQALVLPGDLQADVVEQATRLLDRLADPTSRQYVADEWAGNLLQPGKVRNPLGYLYGLVERARSGAFVPAMALQVADNRKRRAQNEAALARARQSGPAAASITDPNQRADRAPIPAFVLERINALGLARRRTCLV